MFEVLLIPVFTFIDVKLVIIPAAPPIFQVQLHWVVEVPFLWNLLCFLPQRGGGGGGMQAGSEALPLILQPPTACPLPSPGTAPFPHFVSPHKPSGQCQPPPTPTCALGPHPLLEGQQVSSEDVVIDTFVAKPQGEGALDEDRMCWVVAGQRCLLIRTLDSWYANMPAGGRAWLRVSVQRPRGPPSRPGKKPTTPCTGPYLRCVARWDPLYLWSLWIKASAGKSKGGSW